MAKKVLIIDDEEDFVELMTMRFQKTGFEVEKAYSGEEGLIKAKAFRPDVILLDILLTGLDGWEVCRRLRSDPETRDMQIIILTALPPMDLEKSAKNLGVTKIIRKPFDERELIDLLEKEGS